MVPRIASVLQPRGSSSDDERINRQNALRYKLQWELHTRLGVGYHLVLPQCGILDSQTRQSDEGHDGVLRYVRGKNEHDRVVIQNDDRD